MKLESTKISHIINKLQNSKILIFQQSQKELVGFLENYGVRQKSPCVIQTYQTNNRVCMSHTNSLCPLN